MGGTLLSMATLDGKAGNHLPEMLAMFVRIARSALTIQIDRSVIIAMVVTVAGISGSLGRIAHEPAALAFLFTLIGGGHSPPQISVRDYLTALWRP
jgi:hypothetical protein